MTVEEKRNYALGKSTIKSSSPRMTPPVKLASSVHMNRVKVWVLGLNKFSKILGFHTGSVANHSTVLTEHGHVWEMLRPKEAITRTWESAPGPRPGFQKIYLINK